MSTSDPGARAPRTGQPERLPCGVVFDDLLEQVADDRAPNDAAHQANCPHCRATLAELTDVWAPVRDLTESDSEPPESLTTSVMQRVVAIATHGWHAVVTEPLGVTRIAAWVVAVVARRAAERVDGVGLVRGRISPPAAAIAQVRAAFDRAQPTQGQRNQAAGIGVAGRRVVVTIDITAEPGYPLPALAGQIRRSVIEHVSALAGLDVVEVDVRVVDLEDPPAG